MLWKYCKVGFFFLENRLFDIYQHSTASVCPPTSPFMLLFIHLTFCPSIHLHSHPTKFIHLLTVPFICLPILPSVHP